MSSLFNLASATVGGGHQARGGGYRMQRSVRLRSSASAYFNRTFGTATNSTIYTFSTWTKRGLLGSIKPIVQGYLNNNNYGHIIFKADDTIEWREVSVAVNYGQVNTNAVFRDPSAWYHIVVVRNGTSLTIYVNGVSQTLTVSTAVNSAPGYLFGTSTAQRIGNDQVNSAFFDGYLTECYLIDGQALTPSSFGETNPYTGVWRAKRYTGTYGTNGFYLNFSDNSAATAAAIGKDYSGLGNNWTPNNISVTAGVTYDSMLDVPTQWTDGGNGRGNYAIANPVNAASGLTVNDGNLKIAASAGGSKFVNASIAFPSSGAYYAEITCGNATTNLIGQSIGIQAASRGLTSAQNAAGSFHFYGTNAGVLVSNATTTASGLSAISANEVFQVAIDVTNSKMWIGRSNVWYNSTGGTTGDPSTGANPTFTGAFADYFIYSGFDTGSAVSANFNFGQRPFSYTPPSGFKALNTLNLPAPTILKGNQYFDATLWDGNSTNARVITTNVGTVDFAWVKRRNGIDDHRLANSVLGGNNHLKSNATDAESTGTTVIQAFSGNTFTLGTDGSVNATGGTYAGWAWQKGATQGFDIVTYTGTGVARTVAHSLGVAPSMIIVKARNLPNSIARSWTVWHSALSATEVIFLNQTSAKQTGATTYWNSTLPTSSVFSLGTEPTVNGATGTVGEYVAYLFAEVAGFSKFGSYTGNGSADGPFVFCGFRPAFILYKNSSALSQWILYDTVRNTYNAVNNYLESNTTDTENTSGVIDVLSNGFKIRQTGTDHNDSGNAYIFAAFAEHPFKNALAR